jgi:hypothetical protein
MLYVPSARLCTRTAKLGLLAAKWPGNRTTTMNKQILCLDFDGVIHSYTSGWKGADIIPDPPVPGAMDFIREALKYFRVAIFSSRSNQPGGLDAMKDYIAVNSELGFRDPIEGLEWPLEKPAAFVTIDDRAITFDGTWPSIDALRNFKPWNKKG